MKQFKFLPVILISAVLLSACGAGAPAVPTMRPEDVQNTAVAAAFTVVAQTQEAIPTATPLPPSDTPTVTPLPTNTQIALPTGVGTTTAIVAPTSSSSNSNASGNATSDPCATRVLNYSPQGQETIIRIWNNTKAQVTVSLYLNETPGKGECGYRSYSLGKGDDVVITDLVQGCYNLWAWSTTSKPHVNAGGSGCINNDDKWTFEIDENNIKFTSR